VEYLVIGAGGGDAGRRLPGDRDAERRRLSTVAGRWRLPRGRGIGGAPVSGHRRPVRASQNPHLPGFNQDVLIEQARHFHARSHARHRSAGDEGVSVGSERE
jgi:hypothetical protein